MRKIITFCSFIIASLVVVLAFVYATTYIQLAIAILLYLPLAYFTFRALPRKTQNKILPVVAVRPPIPTEKVEAETAKSQKENVAIVDIDKRAFLKLIGGLGISVFLLSIFNRKVGDYFSGNSVSIPEAIALKNAAGNKIDPTEKTPTDGYTITEIDDSAVINYFGFTNKDGSWYIMTQNMDMGTFRYARGASNFPGNWDNRENHRYDYFNNVFKA